MGWWRTASGGVIGDAPANILEEAECEIAGPEKIPEKLLSRIRREYQEALARNPTRRELAELVEFCFGRNGG